VVGLGLGLRGCGGLLDEDIIYLKKEKLREIKSRD
jgi:hypothetical protein